MLACYAGPMLEVVYGRQWTGAATALQVLAVLGLLRVALFIAYDLLIALDGTRALVWLQALWLGALVPALILGTYLDGIRGTAIAHVVVAAGVVTPAFWFVLGRRGVRLAAAMRACRLPAIGGALVAGSALVVETVVVSPLAQLLLGGLIALAVYVPVVLPMRSLLPSKSPKVVPA
jgi:PST family polysaccharide transporter